MKWLKKLAEEDKIGPEAYETIMADVAMIKEASGPNIAAELKEMLRLGSMIGAAAIGTKLGKMVAGKVDTMVGKKKLEQSKGQILIDPMFQGKGTIEKAEARFNEIANIAPHFAMRHGVVKKIIDNNLNSGLSDNTVSNLAMAESLILNTSSTPSASANPAEKLFPKIASIRPNIIGEIVADIYMVKEAALGKDVKDILKVTGLASLVPLSIAGIMGAGNWAAGKFKQKDIKKQLDNSFNTALKMSDPNEELLHSNKDKARQAFQTLAHFAPQVALEPQAARGFMNKIVAYDQGMDINDLKSLTDIQKNLTQTASGSDFAVGMGTGLKFTKGDAVVGDILKGETRDVFYGEAGALRKEVSKLKGQLKDIRG